MNLKELIPLDLGSECQKAAKILDQFIKPEEAKEKSPDSIIPPDIIQKAKGLAILQVIKAGFLWSGRAGTGVVIARLGDGSWSAPSAIATASIGFGAQIGGEMTDFLIVLNTQEAVDAFSQKGNLTVGSNLSVAAGPIGRNAEMSASVSNFKQPKLASMYSYSKTKGMFIGVSLEGSMIVQRNDANKAFYHRAVTAKEILSGQVERPEAGAQLYAALERRSGVGSSSTSPMANSPPSYFVSQQSQNYSALSGSGPSIPPRPQQLQSASGVSVAIAMYDFVAQRQGDLSFKKGDQIEVVKKTTSKDDWWVGKKVGGDGQTGNFPANYVEFKQ
ncbi:hypothetical protein MIR68_006489 [Amoeboaphelidium protococcarum]|nr:hypothetical protein MIR68_006489 [Amoeboaphelidium protococcarum]